ncbi:unnamed protein product [Leuciscus chuanchicus]
MSLIMAPPLPLVFLLMIHGVFCDRADWSVSYSPSHICALKDSTVIMRCTYEIDYYKIKKVFWTKTLVKDNEEPPDLSEDPEYSQRLQYLGDKQKNCNIRLSHVTLKDSHMYYFRFITDKPDGKYTGYPGVTLNVTDLQVESPERVTEGDSVNLRCKSSCALTDRATFIWYRNSQPLTERRDRNNELLLQSVRREDSGRYSCAVDGHTHISPEVQLNVMYPPRRVSVSISPSGVIVEGDSVTLNCISDSNPPAEINWIKGGTIVGSGRIFNISKISSDDSGEYKCKSRNEHGEKYSNAVTLNVMYSPRSVSVLMSGSGVIVEGDSVTLNCISDSNPPALNFSWFKGRTFVGSGRIYNISKISSDDSKTYKCKSINEHGEKYSDAVTLNVMYPPRSVSVLMNGSDVIVEGDSVTLNCISDSNPPALNFSWFKENETSAVGSGQSFSALQSGRFYCQAHNQHGSQRSDAVTVTVRRDAGWLLWLGIPVGCVGIFIIIIIIVLYKIQKKRIICRSAIHEYENDDPSANTYAALDLESRSSDLYNTLPTVHPRPAVHQSGSSEYENLSFNSCPRSDYPEHVMSVRMAPRLPLVILLMIHDICALKDSTVKMTCTFTYPGYYITKVFWTKRSVIKGEQVPDLSEDPEYRQRLQYLGDKQQNCTVRLSHVTLKDEDKYYCSFITDQYKRIHYPGVTLTVTDLQVESPERVTEGDSVNLRCKSSCALTDRATFIWYRNSLKILTENKYSNKLSLNPVRREDSGRYSCAVDGHTHISPEVQLNVMYPPVNPVIYISPSGVIVEGDSVTLNCISDSNPPAEISWIKGGTIVGSGRIYSISKISSDDSEEYKCKSINNYGEKYSDAVTLNVMYPPKNVLVSISGVIEEGDSVTLNCISDSNPPALNFSWIKENETSAVGSGQSFSALQSGRFYCQAHNQHGSQRSDTVTVTVHHVAGGNVIVITAVSGGLFIIIIFFITILFIIPSCSTLSRRSDVIGITSGIPIIFDGMQNESMHIGVHNLPCSAGWMIGLSGWAAMVLSVPPRGFSSRKSSREATDRTVRTMQKNAISVDQAMSTMVVQECYLWLNLADMRETDKYWFLDSPISQVGLFGDTVERFAQQFSAAQKQTEVIRHILPRRTTAASTCPPAECYAIQSAQCPPTMTDWKGTSRLRMVTLIP